MFDEQREFDARFEWGEEGLRRLAPHSDVVVIVDVLSFATAVDIVVARGATVFPCAERGVVAAAFARQVGAILAGDRASDPTLPSYSLSPTSLQALPPGTRLVLPSPNGARLATIAADLAGTVVLGCLRNAAAIAAFCASRGTSIAVIAAGERWRSREGWTGSLRPAVEDGIGAGAILSALPPRNPSPEALAAMAVFRTAASVLPAFVSACASGKELIERGFAADVALAADHDVSHTVPLLRDGQLLNAATPQDDAPMRR